VLVLAEPAEDALVVEGRRRVLERAAEVVPAVEVRAHGRRVERRAVVELHALREVERVRATVLADAPASRERRSEFQGARNEVDQALEDLLRDPERLAVGDERWIEIRGIARTGVDQGVTGGRCRRRLRSRPG